MTTQTIDDQDLSHVKYDSVGGWVRGGTKYEHMGTVSSSTRVNGSFTVAFKGNLNLFLKIGGIISWFGHFQEHQYLSMGHWIQHLAVL